MQRLATILLAGGLTSAFLTSPARATDSLDQPGRDYECQNPSDTYGAPDLPDRLIVALNGAHTKLYLVGDAITAHFSEQLERLHAECGENRPRSCAVAGWTTFSGDQLTLSGGRYEPGFRVSIDRNHRRGHRIEALFDGNPVGKDWFFRVCLLY